MSRFSKHAFSYMLTTLSLVAISIATTPSAALAQRGSVSGSGRSTISGFDDGFERPSLGLSDAFPSRRDFESIGEDFAGALGFGSRTTNPNPADFPARDSNGWTGRKNPVGNAVPRRLWQEPENLRDQRQQDLGWSQPRLSRDRLSPTNLDERNAVPRSLDLLPDAPVGRTNSLPSVPANRDRQPLPSAEPHARPTTDQLITKRYSDPKILRTLRNLSNSKLAPFYVETMQLIDARHVAPSSYQERVETALGNLSSGLSNQAFLRANNIRANDRAVSALQRQLDDMAAQVQVRTSRDAVAIMNDTAQLAQQTVGMPAATVAMEFVYGAVGTLDDYSAFVPPEKAGGPSAGLADNIVGIGVEVEPHEQGLKILRTLSGGPAASADLKRGDVISAIDGQKLNGMEMSAATDLIAGPINTPIQMEIKRKGMVATFTLVRQRVEVHSIAEAKIIDEQNKVAYVKLDQFGEASTKELDAALWKLHEQGMESLVLDVRGNPGGLLTTAIEICDRFLPSGVIVSTRGRTSADNTQETAKFPNTWKTPLVVLIDGNSASASEILAAAVQDNGRGVIVGSRSYGKGTVQTHFPMQTVAGSLKLTTAKFYSPNGREMAGEGVTPDVPVAVRSGRNSDDVDAELETAVQIATERSTREMVNVSLGAPRRNPSAG